MQKTDKKFLALIFIISLSLRILAVFLLKNYINPVDWENGTIARNTIAGKGFSIAYFGPFAHTSLQAPFYPYFLAFFYKFFGITKNAFIIIEIIQACISSFIPVIVYLTTLNIFKKKDCCYCSYYTFSLSNPDLVSNKDTPYYIHCLSDMPDCIFTYKIQIVSAEFQKLYFERHCNWYSYSC